MSDADYAEFVLEYQAIRLGELDCGFVLSKHWKEKLAAFAKDDLVGAVGDVAADPRASFPLNDLPLLIEHAANRREARTRKPISHFDLGEKDTTTTPEWDAKLLQLGIIKPAEAKRRAKAREAKVPT